MLTPPNSHSVLSTPVHVPVFYLVISLLLLFNHWPDGCCAGDRPWNYTPRTDLLETEVSKAPLEARRQPGAFMECALIDGRVKETLGSEAEMGWRRGGR